MSLRVPALFARLARHQRILIAGAGGGYDIYAGLPLALALISEGKQVHLANLTFTYLGGTDAPRVAPNVAAIMPSVAGEDRYLPERTLARWLAQRGLPSTIYAFDKVGVRPLTAAYRALCERLDVEAVVLIDGGTDILMFGDEAGLGTPQEDITSVAAVRSLELPTKLIACLGFGVDTHHGVCHAHFLENVATLERDGAYLGAFSLGRSAPEGAALVDAVAHAHAAMPSRASIVNGSISAAVQGQFGDAQFTERTRGSELFISPLMALYFTFELEGVARRSLYLEQLVRTETIFEVSAIIEAFRHGVRTRPRRVIPH